MESAIATMRCTILRDGTGLHSGAGELHSRPPVTVRGAMKKPLARIANQGLEMRAAGGAHDHMWSIITCPKPEQLTWVAPSIRRAKS